MPSPFVPVQTASPEAMNVSALPAKVACGKGPLPKRNWKPLLHGVAAGSIDPEAYEVNYLAQAHWQGFRYRLGEMIGLDRSRQEVHLAASFDDKKEPKRLMLSVA